MRAPRDLSESAAYISALFYASKQSAAAQQGARSDLSRKVTAVMVDA